jgi:hypothetical protein
MGIEDMLVLLERRQRKLSELREERGHRKKSQYEKSGRHRKREKTGWTKPQTNASTNINVYHVSLLTTHYVELPFSFF